MRLTSRSRDAGSRSVATCPIPIITYQLTASTPASAAAAISDPAFSDPRDRFPGPIAVSLLWAFDHVAGLSQMAIIAGQRVLRKSMSADAIPEWAPIAKDE